MSIRLPEFIDPIRLAESERLLKGQIPMQRMQRLAGIIAEKSSGKDIVAGKDDSVFVDLAFARGEGGLSTVTGDISATVNMVCQRCMQGMSQVVDAHVSLAVVESHTHAEQLPSCYEPLLINQVVDDDSAKKAAGKDAVSLTELIEDELILALPTVALHEKEDCPAGDSFRAESSEEVTGITAGEQAGSDDPVANRTPKKPNPFAVLEQLKDKSNK